MCEKGANQKKFLLKRSGPLQALLVVLVLASAKKNEEKKKKGGERRAMKLISARKKYFFFLLFLEKKDGTYPKCTKSTKGAVWALFRKCSEEEVSDEA